MWHQCCNPNVAMASWAGKGVAVRWPTTDDAEEEAMPEGESWTGTLPAICLGLGGLAAVALLSAAALGPATIPGFTRDITSRVDAELSWKDYVNVVDEALARGDLSDAVRSWQDAYSVALASRRWEALLAAGDAFARIGEASGRPEGARPNARYAYMAALMQAERQRSVDGVRAIGRAFAVLGDADVAAYCERMAAALPASER
jgi:hypothetical protein